MSPTIVKLVRGLLFEVAVIVSILFIYYSPAAAESWQELYNSAIDAYNREDYGACAGLAGRAVAEKSESGTVAIDDRNTVPYYPHWLLCECFNLLGREKDAACHCEGKYNDSQYEKCVRGDAVESDEGSDDNAIDVDYTAETSAGNSGTSETEIGGPQTGGSEGAPVSQPAETNQPLVKLNSPGEGEKIPLKKGAGVYVVFEGEADESAGKAVRVYLNDETICTKSCSKFRKKKLFDPGDYSVKISIVYGNGEIVRLERSFSVVGEEPKGAEAGKDAGESVAQENSGQKKESGEDKASSPPKDTDKQPPKKEKQKEKEKESPGVTGYDPKYSRTLEIAGVGPGGKTAPDKRSIEEREGKDKTLEIVGDMLMLAVLYYAADRLSSDGGGTPSPPRPPAEKTKPKEEEKKKPGSTGPPKLIVTFPREGIEVFLDADSDRTVKITGKAVDEDGYVRQIYISFDDKRDRSYGICRYSGYGACGEINVNVDITGLKAGYHKIYITAEDNGGFETTVVRYITIH